MLKRVAITVCIAAAMAAAGVVGQVGEPVEASTTASLTATIVALDPTSRVVTLKSMDGTIDRLRAGSQVRRFDELRVGDQVTFRYQRSLALRIERPGGGAAQTTSDVVTAHGTGERPGGTIATQITAAVHVEAVDAGAGSIEVRLPDGRIITSQVENANLLDGVHPGDDLVITYTEKLIVSVE